MNARYRIKMLTRIVLGVLGVLILVPALPIPIHFIGVYLFNLEGLSFVPALFRYEIGAIIAAPFIFLLTRYLATRYFKRADQLISQRMKELGTLYFLLPRSDAKDYKLSECGVTTKLFGTLSDNDYLVFDVAGNETGAGIILFTDQDTLMPAVNQFKSEYPGMRIMPVNDEDPLKLRKGEAGWWVELAPLNTSGAIESEVDNVLVNVLSEIAAYSSGMRGGIQIAARQDQRTREELSRKAALATAGPVAGKSSQQKRSEKSVDTRAQRVFFEAKIVVWVVASDVNVARKAAVALARSTVSQFAKSSNPIAISTQGQGIPSGRSFSLFSGSPWTDKELVNLLNLPGESAWKVAPMLKAAPAKPLPPTPACRIGKDDKVVDFYFNQ